jgi:hypothetical protein
MPSKPIQGFTVGGKDVAGNDILYIYAKRPPTYMVYREPMKVAVHFAEDPRKEARQRATIAALNPLRGQINGLVEGWRISPKNLKALEDEHKESGFWKRFRLGLKLAAVRRRTDRAACYDRRVADAVITGLEGSVPDALALLTEIRDGLIAERKSYAETDYLGWAAGAGIAVLVLIWLMSSVGLIPNPPPNMNLIWTGAAAGVLGAFFSIATGLRNRAILIDLQKWTNRRDAILRIAVGTIGAAILLCLLMAGLVSVGGVTDKLASATPTPGKAASDTVVLAVIFGFIAGFSERAVGDLLGRATGSLMDSRKEDVAAAQAKAVQPGAATAALATVAIVPDDDEDLVAASDQPEIEVDGCLCDHPPLDGEILTRDEELPVSVGGVSIDAPPPAVGQPLAAAGPIEQARDIIEKGAAAPGPEEPDSEPTGPKADTPAE